MTAGTFAELMQLKGRYDDLFEAVLEENAALRGKLAESRVRTVRVENRYVPVPETVEATNKKLNMGNITEASLAKALENLNFDMPISNKHNVVPKQKRRAALGNFDTPEGRFKYIHIDLGEASALP